MYYKGTYTITAPPGHYAETWQCKLEVDGLTVEGHGYTVRGACFNANRKMDRARKFKREHEEFAAILTEIVRLQADDSN